MEVYVWNKEKFRLLLRAKHFVQVMYINLLNPLSSFIHECLKKETPLIYICILNI